MTNATLFLRSATIVLVLLTTRGVQAQFAELVRGIPESANVLVIADAGTILESPIARTQGWKASHQQLFRYGHTSIPPNTKLMMVASEINFESVQPAWIVAMLEVTTPPDLKIFAVQQGGRTDSIGGYPAVALPDAYLTELGTNIFGSTGPRFRQRTSRWVNKLQKKAGPTLSPYLTQAYRYVTDIGTHAVLAVDLEDAISEEDVLDRLKASESPYLKGVDDKTKKRLSTALASMRGVMLGINFDRQQHGTVIVDFGKDISIMEGVAKDMLLVVLKDYGAYIDEFSEWTARVDTRLNRITLKGELKTSGRRRIMSMVTIPAAPTNLASSVNEGPDAPPKPDPESKQYATKQYYGAIQSSLDEFRLKNPDAKTLGQVALWLDNYARKIDRLPRKDVYPEVRAYAQIVSTGLRDAAMAYKGIGIQRRPDELGSQGSSHYGIGFYDNFYENRARILSRAKGKAAGVQEAMEILKEVINAESTLRDKVVEKYKIDLPQ